MFAINITCQAAIIHWNLLDDFSTKSTLVLNDREHYWLFSVHRNTATYMISILFSLLLAASGNENHMDNMQWGTNLSQDWKAYSWRWPSHSHQWEGWSYLCGTWRQCMGWNLKTLYRDIQVASAQTSWSSTPLSDTHEEEMLLIEWDTPSLAICHGDDVHQPVEQSLFRHSKMIWPPAQPQHESVTV